MSGQPPPHPEYGPGFQGNAIARHLPLFPKLSGPGLTRIYPPRSLQSEWPQSNAEAWAPPQGQGACRPQSRPPPLTATPTAAPALLLPPLKVLLLPHPQRQRVPSRLLPPRPSQSEPAVPMSVCEHVLSASPVNPPGPGCLLGCPLHCPLDLPVSQATSCGAASMLKLFHPDC